MLLAPGSEFAFVLLGKTYAGLMVDVRPTNAKLWARAVRIVVRVWIPRKRTRPRIRMAID